jgi:hypothetical protein
VWPASLSRSGVTLDSSAPGPSNPWAARRGIFR